MAPEKAGGLQIQLFLAGQRYHWHLW